MIKEIKKEISDKIWYRDNKDGRFYNCCKVGDDRTQIIKIKDLFEILDKYEKKSYEEIIKDLFDKYFNYKNAWGELNNLIYVEQCRKSLPQLKYDAYKEVQHLIQGIKKKHGIEVE